MSQGSDSSYSTKIDATYSFFATDDGEYFTGTGEFTINGFARFMGGQVEQALITLLNENPYKIFSLVIDCSQPTVIKEEEE